MLSHASVPFIVPPNAQRNTDALLWNLSGSTLVHILLILGLGFYINLPTPQILKHTISINLRDSVSLSHETEIGFGADELAKQTPDTDQHSKKIIHTSATDKHVNSGAFFVEQKRLLTAINRQKIIIEEADRIGFLGIFDVHPAYRQYQEYWQQYVSNFGTQHYPNALAQQNLNGQLELDIAIDQQGVVRDIDILRSSGNTQIDNAAIDIAMSASPYAPLPEKMAEEIDILHIIRTWDFNNQTFESKPRG